MKNGNLHCHQQSPPVERVGKHSAEYGQRNPRNNPTKTQQTDLER